MQRTRCIRLHHKETGIRCIPPVPTWQRAVTVTCKGQSWQQNHSSQPQHADGSSSWQQSATAGSSHQEEQGARLTLEAENADMEFGKVISSRREATSLEAVFEELRGHLALSNVKDAEFEIMRVPVDSLRYTHESCSPTFRCGKLLATTTQKFVD